MKGKNVLDNQVPMSFILQVRLAHKIYFELIYQEITNRCHVTVLYFLLILYMFRTHSVSIIRSSIKLTAYATSGTVTVSCGRLSSWLDTECVRNM
jgi:hypothetical protein